MPLIIYKCSKCDMIRDSYEDAERCESKHLSAVSVRETEYRLGAYPFRVVLTFSDGMEREYIADDGFYMGKEVNHANDKNKKRGKGYQSPR